MKDESLPTERPSDWREAEGAAPRLPGDDLSPEAAIAMSRGHAPTTECPSGDEDDPCVDCGTQVWYNFWVTTEVWARICPVQPYQGGLGGVLCVRCIDRRCADAGLTDIKGRFHFTGRALIPLGEESCGDLVERLLATSEMWDNDCCLFCAVPRSVDPGDHDDGCLMRDIILAARLRNSGGDEQAFKSGWDERAAMQLVGNPVIYAAIYPDLVKIGREHGYAVALHGSLQKDADILAVPWSKDASSATALVAAVANGLGATLLGEPTVKAHGRTVFTLSLAADSYIDFGVAPRLRNSEKPRWLFSDGFTMYAPPEPTEADDDDD